MPWVKLPEIWVVPPLMALSVTGAEITWPLRVKPTQSEHGKAWDGPHCRALPVWLPLVLYFPVHPAHAELPLLLRFSATVHSVVP